MSLWSTGAAGPLNCEPCFGELTINGVSMHTSAWCLTDLSDLWGSYELRGSNKVIPGVRGRRAYKRRVDETRYSLPMLITGYCDADGTPYGLTGGGYDDIYSDVYEDGPSGVIFQEGLETNVLALHEALYLDDPSAIDRSLVPAVFTLPSGATRETDVQVLGLRGQLRPGALMRATLELLDVYGLLSVGSSTDA